MNDVSDCNVITSISTSFISKMIKRSHGTCQINELALLNVPQSSSLSSMENTKAISERTLTFTVKLAIFKSLFCSISAHYEMLLSPLCDGKLKICPIRDYDIQLPNPRFFKMNCTCSDFALRVYRKHTHSAFASDVPSRHWLLLHQ